MAFNLKKVLKALLFSSNQALAIKDIQTAFTRFHDTATSLPLNESDEPTAEAETAVATEEMTPANIEEAVEVVAEEPQDAELYTDVPSLVTAAQIRETMDEIAAELRTADEGLLLIEGSAGYRLVTPPRYARWVHILRNDPPPVKLSASALETLSVVAYRQPTTRGEIETIRGVSAEAGLNKLMERELVYIVGRANLPGRPIQYGTTDQFLEFVGIKSLDELPASDVLSNRQIDDWLQTAMNPPKPPADEEMGLPLEEGEPDVSSSEAEAETVSVEPSEAATVETESETTADEEKTF